MRYRHLPHSNHTMASQKSLLIPDIVYVFRVFTTELMREEDPEFHKKLFIADANYEYGHCVERRREIMVEKKEFEKWVEMKCLTIFEKQCLRMQEIVEFYRIQKDYPKQGGIRTSNEKSLAKWIQTRRIDKVKFYLSNRKHQYQYHFVTYDSFL